MSDDDEVPDSDHPGDYITRMEELFDDEDELENQTDDENFVYTGVDADTSMTDYHHQLRDILGPEIGGDEDDDNESRTGSGSPETTKAAEETYSVRVQNKIPYIVFTHVGSGETYFFRIPRTRRAVRVR